MPAASREDEPDRAGDEELGPVNGAEAVLAQRELGIREVDPRPDVGEPADPLGGDGQDRRDEREVGEEADERGRRVEQQGAERETGEQPEHLEQRERSEQLTVGGPVDVDAQQRGRDRRAVADQDGQR